MHWPCTTHSWLVHAASTGWAVSGVGAPSPPVPTCRAVPRTRRRPTPPNGHRFVLLVLGDGVWVWMLVCICNTSTQRCVRAESVCATPPPTATTATIAYRAAVAGFGHRAQRPQPQARSCGCATTEYSTIVALLARAEGTKTLSWQERTAGCHMLSTRMLRMDDCPPLGLLTLANLASPLCHCSTRLPPSGLVYSTQDLWRGRPHAPPGGHIPLPLLPADNQTQGAMAAPLEGRRVCVVGSGITGLSAAWVLHR